MWWGMVVLGPKPQAVNLFCAKDQETRLFLGLSGYYRRFIPDYASIAAPLSDLTRLPKEGHSPIPD